jgi:hypothetical protein
LPIRDRMHSLSSTYVREFIKWDSSMLSKTYRAISITKCRHEFSRSQPTLLLWSTRQAPYEKRILEDNDLDDKSQASLLPPSATSRYQKWEDYATGQRQTELLKSCCI